MTVTVLFQLSFKLKLELHLFALYWLIHWKLSDHKNIFATSLVKFFQVLMLMFCVIINECPIKRVYFDLRTLMSLKSWSNSLKWRKKTKFYLILTNIVTIFILSSEYQSVVCCVCYGRWQCRGVVRNPGWGDPYPGCRPWPDLQCLGPHHPQQRNHTQD